MGKPFGWAGRMRPSWGADSAASYPRRAQRMNSQQLIAMATPTADEARTRALLNACPVRSPARARESQSMVKSSAVAFISLRIRGSITSTLTPEFLV